MLRPTLCQTRELPIAGPIWAALTTTVCQALISALAGSHFIFTQPFEDGGQPSHFTDESNEVQKD